MIVSECGSSREKSDLIIVVFIAVVEAKDVFFVEGGLLRFSLFDDDVLVEELLITGRSSSF